MVRRCVVCKERSPNRLHSFHTFPVNAEIRAQWLKECRMEESELTVSSVVCSKHFMVSDFAQTYQSNKLRPLAVPKPSHLWFDKHMTKIQVPRRCVNDIPQPVDEIAVELEHDYCKPIETENVQPIVESQMETEKLQPETGPETVFLADVVEDPQEEPLFKVMCSAKYIGDLKLSDLSNPTSGKLKLRAIQTAVDSLHNKNKDLRMRNYILQRKLKRIQSLIEDLHDSEEISQKAAERMMRALGF